MEYTRGEWKLHGLTIETHYSPDGHVIACMNDIGNKVQADAHLIAAAPAMYEALKEINDFLGDDEKVRIEVHGLAFEFEAHRIRENCEKALAKAEGKGGK